MLLLLLLLLLWALKGGKLGCLPHTSRGQVWQAADGQPAALGLGLLTARPARACTSHRSSASLGRACPSSPAGLTSFRLPGAPPPGGADEGRTLFRGYPKRGDHVDSPKSWRTKELAAGTVTASLENSMERQTSWHHTNL